MNEELDTYFAKKNKTKNSNNETLQDIVLVCST